MGFILSVARSVAMAFMTFSRIPMPHVEWEERSMRYLLAAFPLVGVVVALVCALWANLAAVLGFAPLVLAAGLVAIPLLVTGGIHLDGFCDVSGNYALIDTDAPIMQYEFDDDTHLVKGIKAAEFTNRIPLDKSTFRHDAVVMKNSAEKVTLIRQNGKKIVCSNKDCK